MSCIRLVSDGREQRADLRKQGADQYGSLKKECYDVYALYFVKYIQTIKWRALQLMLLLFRMNRNSRRQD